MVPLTVASLILSQVADGALIAAREFPLVIKITVAATSLQAACLTLVSSSKRASGEMTSAL